MEKYKKNKTVLLERFPIFFVLDSWCHILSVTELSTAVPPFCIQTSCAFVDQGF